MLRKRWIVLGAAAAAAVLIIPLNAALADPSATPINALTIDGSGDNPVLGAGHSLSFSGVDVTLANAAGGVTVSGSTSSVTLLPPTGGMLAQGPAAPTKTTADATDYGLTVTVNGTTCTTGAGTVTIEQLTLDGTDVTAFAASYKTTCGASTASVAGEIRFNSTSDYVGATQNNASLDFGSADTGFPSAGQTVTFTSVGSQPMVFGKAALGGANGDSFVISGDTCSSKTVATTCTVTVAAKPNQSGAVNGTVSIPDNTKLGSRTIGLTANGHVGAMGTFHALSPARVLDTRNGTGGVPVGPVGPNGVVHLQVGGNGGVPASGVSAVVLNLTETSATTGGFLTVYPTGVTRPTASNLNYTSGVTQANSVTVAVSASGALDLFNSGKSQIIADVAGYFIGSDALSAGGQYTPVAPLRLIDSRAPGFGPLSFEDAYFPGYTFGDTSIDSHITALAVNITAVTPAAAGWFTAWDGIGDAPGASTVNFPKNKTVPNMAIVPTSPCDETFTVAECGGADFADAAQIAVENFAHGNVNLIVDIVGFFDDGGLSTTIGGTRFHPITPQRIVDSRSAKGVPGPLGKGKTDTISAPTSVADDFTAALAMNVTAVSPSVATFLTFWPSGDRPNASTLNPSAHQTVANAAITTLSNSNTFDAFNSLGTTGLIVDVGGFYEFDPATNPAALTPTGTSPFSLHSNGLRSAKAITPRLEHHN